MGEIHIHTVCRKCGRQFCSSTELFDHIQKEHAANVKNNDLHRCAVCCKLMKDCEGHIDLWDIGYRQDMVY
jgi:hypothetical protein